jgi:hypothetical protein
MWGIYAGIAFDAAQSLPDHAKAFWGLAVACFAMALFRAAAVDVAMLWDPRYDAEAWMRKHIRGGDRVEVYGNNVHLPRFPAWAVVERVDTSPLEGRNPLPGVAEVSDRFSDIEQRRPKFVVVSEFWAARYLWNRSGLEKAGKRELTPMEVDELKDVDSRAFFRNLRDGHLAYRWAHLSEWRSLFWPRVDIHESLTRDVWIFERI